VKRAEQLRNDKLISEAELDTLQSTVAALQAQLDALQSQVNVADANVRVQQQNISDLTVRAPFAGVVISKDAQPGEMVSPISAGGGYTRTGIPLSIWNRARLKWTAEFRQSRYWCRKRRTDAYPD
jgi:multidrug efflux pump subunit AcrA (membrane-fusion protein)